MRPNLLLIACAIATAGIACAQMQESGLVSRIDLNTDRAIQAMNENAVHPKAKADPSLTNSLGNKSFAAAAFGTKTFATAEFAGTKSAPVKTFETRSFLGIKNPWFGKKVFDTEDASFAKKAATEAEEKFKADSYAVKKFMDSSKTDSEIAGQEVPSNSAPRQYLGPEQPNKQAGYEQFTKDVHRDLSIDEVRDLLNKGQQAK